MEVKDLPTYTSTKRDDRQGKFFQLMGYNFLDLIGLGSPEPTVDKEKRRV